MNYRTLHAQFAFAANIGLAALMIVIWIAPNALGSRAPADAATIVGYEYICVFLGTFLTLTATSDESQLKRSTLFTIVAALLLAITALWFLEDPDLLLALAGAAIVTKNIRLMGVRGERDRDREIVRGLLTLASILLPILVFFVIEAPVPALGFAQLEQVQPLRFGGGDPFMPQQMLAIGIVYFVFQAILVMRFDRPFGK